MKRTLVIELDTRIIMWEFIAETKERINLIWKWNYEEECIDLGSFILHIKHKE